MIRSLMCLLFVSMGPAKAEPVRVVTDIAPVASLVATVLGEHGSAEVLVTPGASPHDFSLRPSQARSLSEADLVVWIGPGLTPWMARALHALAADRTRLTLFGVPGTHHLESREAGGHGHDSHGDHDHGDDDPHAWLDPENAQVWLAAIAQALSALDPDNAPAYAQNAATAQADLAAVSARVATQVNGARYVVYHDAFHYFEDRFGAKALGFLSASDATDPSPRDVAEMRAVLSDAGVPCLLADTTSKDRVIATVSDGQDVTVVAVDALGQDLDAGPGLYVALIEKLGNALAACK